MKKILEQLFYGKIYPAERRVFHSEAYQALDKVITEERTALKASISAEDAKRLMGFEELLTQSSAMEEVETFTYGFRLGALLMSEIFIGEELCHE